MRGRKKLSGKSIGAKWTFRLADSLAVLSPCVAPAYAVRCAGEWEKRITPEAPAASSFVKPLPAGFCEILPYPPRWLFVSPPKRGRNEDGENARGFSGGRPGDKENADRAKFRGFR